MRHVSLALALVLILAGAPAFAQLASGQAQVVGDAPPTPEPPPPPDDCPEGVVCVEYEGVIIALDPGCGPIIGFVVEQNLAQTTTLQGPGDEYYGVRAAVFLEQPDGTYALAGHVGGSAAERFDDARIESVGCMVWETPDE